MTSAANRGTEGFGCPKTVDPHHFTVEVPPGRTGFVLITEHYGIKAGIDGLPEVAERCELPRPVWSLIAEHVKREFNERLRSKKMKTSRWMTGTNKVERLLGKELLVLAWAIEQASPDLVLNAVRNWIGLRPEERWWLYNTAAAATGGLDQSDIGWRKALRYALTENPLEQLPAAARPQPAQRRKQGDRDDAQQSLPLTRENEQSPFLEDGRQEGRNDD